MGRSCIYAGIVLVVALGLLVAAYVGYVHIPSISDQVASKGDLTVRIVNPPSDSWYPADAAIPFLSTAQSARNIAALEYWVDGKLVQSEPRAPGSSPRFVVQTWRWMPLVEGDHLVTVRARSETGTVATSNIVRIHAQKAAGYRILYTVRQGDTWESIAKLCTTSIEAIAQQNPLLKPPEALMPGLQMWIPCNPMFPSIPAAGGSTPPLSEGEAASDAPAPGSDLGTWVSQNMSPAATLPAAPELQAGLDGCTVSLLVQDASKDEQGFLVYRSGASNFEQIAELGSNPGGSFTYTDDLQVSGALQYYVSAFNAAGEAQSNIVPVQAAEGSCGPVSNPNVQYANGILSLGSGLDLAYLYASLDKSPWQRVPQGEEFFQPTGGQVDLTGYIEPLLAARPATKAADLEVWGWRGGVIENLGLLHITFERTTLEYCSLAPEPCTGDVGGSNWTKEDGVVGSNLGAATTALTFRFRANAPGVQRVLAQISSEPFSSEYDPSPPYLIEADAITGTGSEGSLNGQFTIQFANFNKPKDAGQFPYLSNLSPPLQNVFGPDPPPALSPFSQFLLQQMNTGLIGGLSWSDLYPPTFYIRVMPWAGSGPVGKVSNTIAITYKPIEQKPMPIIALQPAIYDIKVVGFTGEQQINPDTYGCVTIVAVDEAKLRASLWKGIEPNSVAGMVMEDFVNRDVADYLAKAASHYVQCPPPRPPMTGGEVGLGDVFGAMEEMWNAVVQTYEGLKQGIVSVVAQFVVAPLTGSCEETCQGRLLGGLNLAITYFTGIPPNLPTTDELIDAGLNYAVDAAIKQAGVDCGDLCRWQIDQGIQATREALKQAGSQPGCWAGGENAARYGKVPMCLPDGLTLEPIPGAAYQPAMAEVEITRNGQAIVASARQFDYYVQVTTSVNNAALVGQKYPCLFGFGYDENGVYGASYPEFAVPEPAQGTPYLNPVKLELPGELEAGKPLTLPIIFKLPRKGGYVYPPFQAQGAPPTCSPRMLTSPGYTITVNATLMCTDLATSQSAPCPPSQAGSMQDTQTYRP